MLVLGIDPGLGNTGYGIVKIQNNDFSLVDFGVIKTNTKDKLCDAFLWVKPPGESDGRKYKGKIAGRFDHIKALELINNKKNA